MTSNLAVISEGARAPAAATMVTVDANEAVASVAYRLTEVIAIYPITLASAMGEHAGEWSAKGRPNLWETVPHVVEMQSEAGAAGAVHGALQGGALVMTFTASQGLLLMVPNLYNIAGELTACCIHVAARSIATHALSRFGDHSDVMATRGTEWALLASGSPQEAQDLATIGQAATLVARVPFLHVFDGFRTAHEIQKIVPVDDLLIALFDADAIAAHRHRALDLNRPVTWGTSRNPDAFFQGREATYPFYGQCPTVVADTMDRFAALTGRRYRLFDYVGHRQAERAVVMMGSGTECAHQTVDALVAQGELVGLLKMRLYRPFAMDASQVWRICRALDLKPWQTESWMTSHDPDFWSKAADVCGLYLNPARQRRGVVDRREERHAGPKLDQPDLAPPPGSGRPSRTSRSPGVRVSPPRHRRALFRAQRARRRGHRLGHRLQGRQLRRLLGDVVEATPTGRQLHCIVDKLSAHFTPAVEAFLEDHPHVFLHKSPTYASWLNQVELFFSILQRGLLSGGEFDSVDDLAKRVIAFIEDYNRRARPFRWSSDGRPLKA